MSNSIDKRVVEMEFRNQQFERNAEKTNQTLKKLEESLDFDKHVSKSLDTISSKFTAFGLVGQSVINNLTDSVVNLGKTMVNALVFDGMTTGFNQYESVLTSSKVLMNATGKPLEVVTKHLDEMQRYAQETVYDFAFMTENITKFVNAGLDLDKSVDAMKGLGNAMAYAGVEGQKANSVIYNFSQALSVGYMGLIDWKSLELAGMATKQFKQVLLDTAEEMGTVVKVGEKYRSVTKDLNGNVSNLMDTENMRNELSSRWLTNDVLIAAMAKYNDETTELGQAAAKAAKDINKFSKMLDALKEERSGGWATTFKIIFGDLQEATEMWTGIYNRIEKWLSGVAEFRNNIFQAWAGFGGRDEAIEAFHNMLTVIESISSAMGKALNKLFEYNKGWRWSTKFMDTVDIGPVGNVIYESMVKASRGINEFTKSLIPSEATLRSITDIATGFATIIRDVFSVVGAVAGIVGKVLKTLSPLLKILLAIGGVIGNIILQISNAIREALNLGPAASNINEFLDNMYDNINAFSDAAVEKIYEIPEKFANFLEKLKSFDVSDFKIVGSGIVEGISAAIANFKEKRTIGSFFEGFFSSDAVKAAGEALNRIFGNIKTNFSNFISNLRENILKLGPVGEFIVSIFDFVVSVVTEAINAVKRLIPGLGDTLGDAGNKLSEFLKGMNIKDLIDIAKIGVFIGSMVKLKQSLTTVSSVAKEAKNFLETARESINKFGLAVRDIGKGVKMSLQAEAFKNVAFGLGVLVASIIALATIDPESLDKAITTFAKIVVIVGALIIVIDNLKGQAQRVKLSADNLKTTMADVSKTLAKGFANAAVLATVSMVFTSIAVLFGALTAFISSISVMKPSDVRKALGAITEITKNIIAVIAALGLFILLLTAMETFSGAEKVGFAMVRISASLSSLAFGLTALVVPIAKFGAMDPAVFEKGFGAIKKILTVIALSFAGMTVFSSSAENFTKNLMAISMTMAGFTTLLIGLLIPIFALGNMKPEKLSAGLQALGIVVLYVAASMVALSGALRIMGKESGSVIKMSLAFAAFSGAIAVLSLLAPMIMSNADNVKRAIIKLIDVTVGAIVDSADKILEGALELISEVLLRLIQYLPYIMVELEAVISILLDWLIEYLPGIMDKVGKAIGVLVTSLAKSLTENINLKDLLVVGSAILALVLLIKEFAKLKDKLKDAIPVLVTMTIVISAIGLVIGLLVKNGVEGAAAISSAVSISIVLKVITSIAKQLPAAIKGFKQVKPAQIVTTMASLIAVLAPIAMFFAFLRESNLDGTTMVMYSAGLSMAVLAISPMLVALGKLNKNSSNLDLDTLVAVVVEIGLIAAALGAILVEITKTGVDPVKMASYAAALSIAFIGISPMILSLAALQKYASQAPKASNIMAVLGEIAGISVILVGTLALFTALPFDANTVTRYAGALAITFVGISPMILSLAVVQKACAGFNTQSLKPMLGILIAVGGIALVVAGAFAGMSALQVDPTSIIQYAEAMSLVMVAIVPLTLAIGLMAGILGAFNVDGKAIMKAGSGLLVVVGLAALLFGTLGALMGALDYMWDGQLSVAMENSVPMFESIGQMIGSLIGGLIGAIGGSTLGSFAKTAQPFFDAISALPSDFGEKMTALASGFMGLVGAGFVLAITDLFSLFTGESSLSKLGKELAEFGPYLGTFVDNFPEMTTEKAESIKLVAEGMKSLVDAMPREGGLVQLITGTTDMEGFVNNIGALGKGMAEFAQYTEDLDATSVENAVHAGKMMTSLASCLPKTGGVVQWWGGEVDMSGFAKNLPLLAQGIVAFNDIVTADGKSKINSDSVETAVDAGEMIAGLWDSLPKTDGIFQDIFGTKDLAGFAKNLPILADGIVAFNDTVTSEGHSVINEEAVRIATWAGQELAGLWDALPKTGGLFQDIFGDKDLTNFAQQLPLLGFGIASFSDKVQNIDGPAVATAVTALNDIAKIQDFLVGDQGGWIDSLVDKGRVKTFVDNIPKFGSGIKSLSDNMKGADLTRINSVTDALNSIANIVMLTEDLGGFSYDTFQKAIESIDVDSVSSAAEALSADESIKKIGDKFKIIGRGYIECIYEGMRGEDRESKELRDHAVKDMTNALYDAITNDAGLGKEGRFYNLGVNMIKGICTGLSEQSRSPGTTFIAKSVINKLYDTMAKAAEIHSPSKRSERMAGYIVDGIGVGMKKNTGTVLTASEAMTDKVFITLANGMSRVYELLHSDQDFEPTISPVVDIRSAQKSIEEMNYLFSESNANARLFAGEAPAIQLTRGVKMEAEASITQTDLSKITDGMAKIGQKLSDLEKIIGNTNIYLDSGALVGGMSAKMAASLAKRQTIVARGVIPSKIK